MLIFFVPFVIFEFPSTILVRRLGPRFYLGAISLAWGAVMIGFGFVHDWTTLVGLRIILGVFEVIGHFTPVSESG